MLAWDPIDFAHVPLGLIPEIFDSVNVFVLFDKPVGMIDPVMFAVGDIENIIGPMRVGIHDCVWDNSFLHNSHQVLAFISGITFL